MTYILFSLSTAFFFTLTFLLRKLATKTVSLPTALFVEVVVEMVLLTVVFLFLSPELKKGFDFRINGIALAALAGLTVALGVASNYFALRSGLFSKVTSITSPSQIIFGLLIGLLFLKDTLQLKHIAGVLLGIISVLLLAG